MENRIFIAAYEGNRTHIYVIHHFKLSELLLCNASTTLKSENLESLRNPARNTKVSSGNSSK